MLKNLYKIECVNPVCNLSSGVDNKTFRLITIKLFTISHFALKLTKHALHSGTIYIHISS
jgi:hypothetical protein